MDEGGLVKCPGDSFTKTLDLRQDGFGGRYPDKGTGLRVVLLHEVIDFADEGSNAGERTTSNCFLGHDAEEAFYLIYP